MHGGSSGDDDATVMFSDRGSPCTGERHSKAFQELRSSAANTAWTNGTVERMMLEIVKKFMAVRTPLKDRVRIVPVVQAALNAGYRERLKASPFNLMFGRKPYSINLALVAPGKDE